MVTATDALASKATIVALAIYGHLSSDKADSLYEALDNSDFAADEMKAEVYALLEERLHSKLPLREAEAIILRTMKEVLYRA